MVPHQFMERRPTPLRTARTVLRQNADGVEDFNTGQYNNAIVCFKDGLTICRQLLSSQEAQEQQPAPQEDHEVQAISEQASNIQDVLSLGETIIMKPLPTTPKFRVVNQPHGGTPCSWFMYNRPIRNPATAECLLHHPKNWQAISAILIFNLALAHHRLGTENHNSTALHQAARLYKCAWDAVLLLLTTERTTSTAASAKDCTELPCFWRPSTSFSLACVNNTGLALLQLGQTEAACGYFQHLAVLHMFLVVQHQQEEDTPDLPRDVDGISDDGYVWNFSQILYQDSQIVPPAA